VPRGLAFGNHLSAATSFVVLQQQVVQVAAQNKKVDKKVLYVLTNKQESFFASVQTLGLDD
jgi:hypothetical protein